MSTVPSSAAARVLVRRLDSRSMSRSVPGRYQFQAPSACDWVDPVAVSPGEFKLTQSPNHVSGLATAIIPHENYKDKRTPRAANCCDANGTFRAPNANQ